MIPLTSQSVQAIIRILDRQGASSRAGIAKATGLSKQAVSAAMATLEQSGWVHEVGISGGYQGRAATLYDINPDAAHVLAIVLGREVELALCDLAGNVVGRTGLAWGGLDAVVAAAKALGKFAFVGLAVPGVVAPVTGLVSAIPVLPELDGVRLATAFSELAGVPAVAVNDANAGALMAGDGDGCKVYLTVGHGVGMGILNEGRILRGSTGAAGEAALLQVNGQSIEAQIGDAALMRSYRSNGGLCATLPEALADPSSAGRAIVHLAAHLMAEALVPVKALLDPEVVMLGGVTGATDGFIHVLAGLTNLPFVKAPPQPELHGAARVARAGLLAEVFHLVP